MGSLGLSTNILHDRAATSNAILSVNAPSSVLCCQSAIDNRQARMSIRGRAAVAWLRAGGAGRLITYLPQVPGLDGQAGGEADVVPVRGDGGPIRRVPVQQHHRRPVVGERRRPDLVYIDDPRLSPSYASLSSTSLCCFGGFISATLVYWDLSY